jgi:O-6-methylguanine DNA methyltransferase
MSTFQDRVKDVVRNIPKGKVMSYAEVARAAGNPRAARVVASVMAKNFDPAIPCHRVVHSDGRPGGYNKGGETAKSRLLAAEGVVLLQNRIKTGG